MKKLALLGIVPLFAGATLFAQTQNQTTTTTTSYSGTLVDAGCAVHRTQQNQNGVDQNGNSVASKETTITTNCPVKQSTSEFGIVTPKGEFIQFAPNSNQEVVTMIRKHHRWHTEIVQGQPVTVHVMAAPNGDTIVVRQTQ